MQVVVIVAIVVVFLLFSDGPNPLASLFGGPPQGVEGPYGPAVGTPPRKTNNQTAAAIGALGGAAACAAGGATAPLIGVCAAAGAALAPAIEDFGTGVGELASGQFSTCKGSCDAHTAADVQALLAKIPNVAMTQPLRDCIKAKCAEKFASAPPPPSSAIQNQQFIANGAARLFGTTAATSSPQSRIFGNR